MKNLDQRVAQAVQHFWRTRTKQSKRQGSRSGQRDRGNRRAATGGKHLDGFCVLVSELLQEAGIPPELIHHRGRAAVTIPGFFRPTKQWDLVVASARTLLAAVELKSLCGPSFSNNYNNRVEEAVGSATDIWTAYREGAFDSSPRPFVGYLLLLEEADESTRPIDVSERHFNVFEEYRDASYARRCEASARRLVRERCYDAACLLLADRVAGLDGRYRQPASDLTFARFASLLCSQVGAVYASL